MDSWIFQIVFLWQYESDCYKTDIYLLYIELWNHIYSAFKHPEEEEEEEENLN